MHKWENNEKMLGVLESLAKRVDMLDNQLIQQRLS